MGLTRLERSARDHLLLQFAANSRSAARQPLLVLERGEGPYVWDDRGRRYVDALSSLFCCQLGYSFGAELAEAAAEQMRRLAFNTTWNTAHPPAIELAERLAGLAPAGLTRSFFTSGGSEAVESAWKLARMHHVARGEPRRTKAIAREIAYHGSTLGALSLTGVAAAKQDFGAPPIEVARISTTNAFRSGFAPGDPAFAAHLLAELEDVLAREDPATVAAVFVEPVQNSGGSIVAPPGYWAGLRRIADAHGILLVADEVITGCGRLGHWFGVERCEVVPDMITVAKGLASAAAPIGAVLVSERVAEPLLDGRTPLRHGLTFGGHPVAAAVALRNVELFEREGVLDNVRAHEAHFEARLRELLALEQVGDVRGAGFFWSLELVPDDAGGRFARADADRLVKEVLPPLLLEAGVIARPDNRGEPVIQLAPPLVCDRDVLDEIVERVGGVIEGLGSLAAGRSDVGAPA